MCKWNYYSTQSKWRSFGKCDCSKFKNCALLPFLPWNWDLRSSVLYGLVVVTVCHCMFYFRAGRVSAPPIPLLEHLSVNRDVQFLLYPKFNPYLDVSAQIMVSLHNVRVWVSVLILHNIFVFFCTLYWPGLWTLSAFLFSLLLFLLSFFLSFVFIIMCVQNAGSFIVFNRKLMYEMTRKRG